MLTTHFGSTQLYEIYLEGKRLPAYFTDLTFHQEELYIISFQDPAPVYLAEPRRISCTFHLYETFENGHAISHQPLLAWLSSWNYLLWLLPQSIQREWGYQGTLKTIVSCISWQEPITVPGAFQGQLEAILSWETQLAQDPGLAPIYHDWCQELGWEERALQLCPPPPPSVPDWQPNESEEVPADRYDWDVHDEQDLWDD